MPGKSKQYFESKDFQALLGRYEKSGNPAETGFFDSHEFESIIDYYMECNQYGKAFRAVERSLVFFPVSSDFMIKKAQLLTFRGEFAEAVEILTLIEKLEPLNPEPFLLRGKILTFQKNEDAAEDQFEKAIELAVHDKEYTIDILLETATSFEFTGNFKKALHSLKKAYHIAPENPDVLFELAYCYEQVFHYKKSIEYYDQYLTINPFSKEAWLNTGEIYCMLEDFEKAVECFDFALAIDDKYVAACLSKADLFLNQEKYSDAVSLFTEILSFNEDTAEVLCSIGECYEKMKDFPQALYYYKMTLEKDEDYAEAWFGKGIVMLYQDQLNDSLVLIKKAISIDKHNPEFWHTLAIVHTRMGNHEDSIFAFKRAIELDPYDEDLWISYSEMMYKSQKIDDAIGILSQCHDIKADSAIINYRLAAYLMERKKTDLACLYFETGLQQDFGKYPEFFSIFPQAEDSETIKQLINKYKYNF